ncbi:MAG: hypothetical protein GY751_11625 [Bacteroidetes bacterium]|nr:hypothetical protein [Bacteroidota bacterium]
MQFKDVIGQQRLKTQLINEAQSDRIPHAQLFLARPGTGALPLAMAFAQYINCDGPGETDSCGLCPSCVKSAQMIHPDIHYSFPVIRPKNKKAPKLYFSDDFINEWRDAVLKQPYINIFDWLQFIDAGNKQGNLTAEECRRISRKLQLRAFEGKYKVQIIWMVESFEKEGNRLLKLLEEPPADTILILIAEEQEKILPTILSRTQIKVVEDLELQDVQKALLALDESDDERLSQIAFFADGNFHRALELHKNTSKDMFKWLDTWLSASMNNNANQLLEFISYLNSEGREKVKHFFDYMLHFFRECITLQFKHGSEVRLVVKEKALAERIWKFADLDSVSRVIELIEEKYYHVERNVNAKYILLDLSIRTRKIFRKQI